jgi:predicted Fe-Mo cluster-binding NifX family protein
MPYKIAITSRDGKVVTEHFGKARYFHIVELDNSGYRYLESRELEPCCKGSVLDSAPHEHHNFDSVIELLADCEAVVTARIGPGAAEQVIQGGLRIFEGRGLIDDILTELIEQQLLQQPEQPAQPTQPTQAQDGTAQG